MTTNLPNEFSDYVLKIRKLNYCSARNFWNTSKDKLSISYERYSRIEKGELTTVKTALELVKALHLDEYTALHAWMRSQLTKSSQRSYFADPVKERDLVKNKLTINSSQKKIFEEIPFLYRVIIYLALFSDKRHITEKTLSQDFNLSYKEAQIIVNKLQGSDLIDLRKERLQFSGWCMIPDDQKYRNIRRKNFNSMVKNHFDHKYTEESSLEKTSIRRVQPKNINDLRDRVNSLFRWWANTDLVESEEGIPYSFFIGGAPIDTFKNDVMYWGFRNSNFNLNPKGM